MEEDPALPLALARVIALDLDYPVDDLKAGRSYLPEDDPRERSSATTASMSPTSKPICVDSPEAEPVERKRWNSPDAAT